MGLPGASTPGTIIGSHYIIGDLINSGGFGAVYRGTDTSEGNRPCAIKEIYNVTPTVRRQALMETSVLLTVRSPHLPEVYDALEANGRFYLIMELIAGQNLSQLLQNRVPGGIIGEQEPFQQSQGPCSEQEVLDWLLPVMDILQELHSRNPPIIHRDIKPGNIILRPDQTAVLVDFGLTKLYDPDRNTQSMIKAVSQGFSPIEQYMGKTGPQSDVYSMAATMYLLWTNRRPPRAIDRGVHDTLLPPHQFNPALSQHIEQVLLQAMSLQAQDRYQSMRDFMHALQDTGSGPYNEPTLAVPPVGGYTSSPQQQPLRLPAPPPAPPMSTSGYPQPVSFGYRPAQTGVQTPPPYPYTGSIPPPPQRGKRSMQPGSLAQPVPGYGMSMAPQMLVAPPTAVPSAFNQGCLWGLVQGVLAGFLVALTQNSTNFYLALIMGFLFYVLAGFVTARRGGSPWRSFWSGFWAGIFSTIIFWIVYFIGVAIRIVQRLALVSKQTPGRSGMVLYNEAIQHIHTALPSSQAASGQNLLVLLGGGLLLAACLGWVGGLLGKSARKAAFVQKKRQSVHP
jgi:serine/threonine protein kinase